MYLIDKGRNDSWTDQVSFYYNFYKTYEDFYNYKTYHDFFIAKLDTENAWFCDSKKNILKIFVTLWLIKDDVLFQPIRENIHFIQM